MGYRFGGFEDLGMRVQEAGDPCAGPQFGSKDTTIA